MRHVKPVPSLAAASEERLWRYLCSPCANKCLLMVEWLTCRLVAAAFEGAGGGAEERAGPAGSQHLAASGAGRQLLPGATALAGRLARLPRHLRPARQRRRAAAAAAAERRCRGVLHLPPCRRQVSRLPQRDASCRRQEVRAAVNLSLADWSLVGSALSVVYFF